MKHMGQRDKYGKDTRGAFLLTEINFIPAWICNHMRKVRMKLHRWSLGMDK